MAGGSWILDETVVCPPRLIAAAFGWQLSGEAMRFEARELKPYAELVDPIDLKVGATYFALAYLDADMLLPTLDTEQFYFQDTESYSQGSVTTRQVSTITRPSIQATRSTTSSSPSALLTN